MFRRSFITAVPLAAPMVAGLSACRSTSPAPSPASPPPPAQPTDVAEAAPGSPFAPILERLDRPATLALALIDDHTPFADTGVPYLMALLEAGHFRRAHSLRVQLGPGYGRDEGHAVDRTVSVLADDRAQLERFFEARDPAWRLPSTHQIRYGPVLVPGSSPAVAWRAYVVDAQSVLGREHLLRATVGEHGVELAFDRIGAQTLSDLSEHNVGRKAAIMVGGIVLADPVFNGAIPGGQLWVGFDDDGNGHHALVEALRPVAG